MWQNHLQVQLLKQQETEFKNKISLSYYGMQIMYKIHKIKILKLKSMRKLQYYSIYRIMSYANDLWNKLSVVLSQSIERRKELDDFIYAISKRIQCEEDYAKNIQAIGGLMDKYIIKKGTSSFTYSAFKSDHIHRAEQAKDEILIVLKEIQQIQNAECKKIEKQAKKIEKQMIQYSEKMNYSKNKLQLLDKQREQQLIMMEIVKISSESTLEKKQKQLTKMKESQKQFKQYQPNYKMVSKQYNQFLLAYYHQLDKILSTFEHHEEKRMQKQVDSIMKILVFETAMMRNFDYDISNISQQMETIQPRDDINTFIKNHSDGIPKLQPNPLNVELGFLSKTLSKIAIKQFQSRLSLEKNEYIRSFIQIHYSTGKVQEEIKGFDNIQKKDFQKILGFVEPCWRNQPINLQKIQGEFKELMNKDMNRFYGGHFSLQLMQGGYKSAQRMFQIAIEKSVQKKDAFTIRKLVGLIFSYWTMDPPRPSQQELQKMQTMSMNEDMKPMKPKRKPLYVMITHLLVWRSQDFWEAVIFESIQQQLLGIHHQKGQTQSQTKAKQKNVVFSQLASYSHIMVMFGNTPKNVRLSIGRFSRLYGLGEEESKDLSKTISETWKVYKDLLSKQGKNQIDIEKKDEHPTSDFRKMML